MGLKTLPATVADAARAVQIEKIAFGPNPVSEVLFPGPVSDAGDEHRVIRLQEQLESYKCTKAAKVIDEELEAQGKESMVAFGLSFIWEDALTPENLPPSNPPGPGSNPDALNAFFGGMRDKLLARYEGKPLVCKYFLFLTKYKKESGMEILIIQFLDVKIIETDPAHHRRGAGGQLLKYASDEADRLGIPCYLEATDAGKPLYEKHGYRTIDTFEYPLHKYGGTGVMSFALMERPASRQT